MSVGSPARGADVVSNRAADGENRAIGLAIVHWAENADRELPFVRSLLADPESRVRAEAACLLKFIGDASDIPALRAMFNDGAPGDGGRTVAEMAMESAYALRTTARLAELKRAPARVRELLTSSDPVDRAIGLRFTEHSTDSEEIMDMLPLVEALFDDEEEALIEGPVGALARRVARRIRRRAQSPND